MGKTGGGRGTNQHQTKGVSDAARPEPAAPAAGPPVGDAIDADDLAGPVDYETATWEVGFSAMDVDGGGALGWVDAPASVDGIAAAVELIERLHRMPPPTLTDGMATTGGGHRVWLDICVAGGFNEEDYVSLEWDPRAGAWSDIGHSDGPGSDVVKEALAARGIQLRPLM